MFGLVSAFSEGLEVRARYILKSPNKFFLSFAEASFVFFRTKLLLYIEWVKKTERDKSKQSLEFNFWQRGT